MTAQEITDPDEIFDLFAGDVPDKIENTYKPQKHAQVAQLIIPKDSKIQRESLYFQQFCKLHELKNKIDDSIYKNQQVINEAEQYHQIESWIDNTLERFENNKQNQLDFNKLDSLKPHDINYEQHEKQAIKNLKTAIQLIVGNDPLPLPVADSSDS